LSYEGALLPMLILEIVFATLIGLAFGSFLNVCISRLPRHESVVQPPSHCPHCKAPIAVRDNIPLISFFLLRGRCRHCNERIAWRYPFVEAGVAALTVGNLLYTGLAFDTVVFIIFDSLLLALAVCDAETMRLPDALTLPLLGLGILWRACDVFIGEMHRGTAYAWHSARMLGLRATISAVATALALLVLRWLYALIRRRQGLGLGDVKLAAAIAAWLGARQMCVVFFLAVVTGALTAIVVFAIRGNQKTKSEGPLAVPFGTFLALSGIYCSFLGDLTLNWYLGFFH
jgi:leader peptidase (prepilin peptidase) / N-methyltransferase